MAHQTQAASAYSSRLHNKRILVTGGNGYIGSHTVLELLTAGAQVTVIDNLSNSNPICLQRVQQILHDQSNSNSTTTTSSSSIAFHKIDLRDKASLTAFFTSQSSPFDACIHFAGLKSVGESVSQPLRYYDNNVVGTLNLLELLELNQCFNIVFSSSATVYGVPESNPIAETASLHTTNPYGQTKLVIEEILRDITNTPNSKWNVVILRYFNPIGAHPTGLIGEDPNGIPNNLLPFVTQVAVGRREAVNVFGNDYPTVDGTGVRDYIHVVDLALGHLAALANGVWGSSSTVETAKKSGAGSKGKCVSYNLGTGEGYSVLQVVAAAEKASGKKIPVIFGPRRAGDVAACYSDPSKAHQELQWRTQYGLERAVQDSWRWQEKNPNGFAGQTS